MNHFYFEDDYDQDIFLNTSDDEFQEYKNFIDQQTNILDLHDSFEDFCQDLYEKIDPSKVFLITTFILKKIDKAFSEELKNEWIPLNRKEKRKKELILRKYYANKDLVIKCLTNEPDKYLRYARESFVRKYSKKKKEE